MLCRLALITTWIIGSFGSVLAQGMDPTPRAWNKPVLAPSSFTENLCKTWDHREGYEASLRTAWFLRCGHGGAEAVAALSTPTPPENSLPPEPYIYPSMIIKNGETEAYSAWVPDLATCDLPKNVEWGALCKGVETCDSLGVCPSDHRKWRRDSRSDSIKEDGKCDAGEDCVLYQTTRNLFWMKYRASQPWNHTEWNTFCQNLSYGGYMDWRLPSKSEAMRGYFDALWKANRHTLFQKEWWWGSRTSSQSQTQAEHIWWVNIDTGVNYELHQTYNPGTHGLCVRP